MVQPRIRFRVRVTGYGSYAPIGGRTLQVIRGAAAISSGVHMNIDDSWLIARFQRLITEMLIEKRLGQRRPELTDELYQTWREVEQRGLKETPLWLAGLVRLTSPDAAVPSTKTECTDRLSASSQAAA